MRRKPYIVCTTPYTHKSMGVKVQHLLCHELNKIGETAFVTATQINYDLITPVALGENTIKNLVTDKDAIVIYPEDWKGNSLKAKPNNIARWCLSRPGLFGGDERFDGYENVYAYNNSIKKTILFNDVQGVLRLPGIEREIFKNTGQERNVFSFYTGKSEYKPGFFDPENAIRIDRDSAFTRQELADILNNSITLYCFDKCSSIIDEARLCGCPVLIIDDGILNTNLNDHGSNGLGIPIHESLEADSPHGVGIIRGAFDFDLQIDLARASIEHFENYYSLIEHTFKENLRRFVYSSQNW